MKDNVKTDTIHVDNNTYKFNVDIYIFKERENYISYCPSLDICSSGEDISDSRVKGQPWPGTASTSWALRFAEHSL